MDYSTCRQIDHFHYITKAGGYEYDHRFSPLKWHEVAWNMPIQQKNVVNHY